MLLLKEDKKITDEDIIEKIISSKGSIADKIGMLIRARRDNHGNESIQKKCNKALDWLYDLKYHGAKVITDAELAHRPILEELEGIKYGLMPYSKYRRGIRRPETVYKSLEDAKYNKSSYERCDGMPYIIIDMDTKEIIQR